MPRYDLDQLADEVLKSSGGADDLVAEETVGTAVDDANEQQPRERVPDDSRADEADAAAGAALGDSYGSGGVVHSLGRPGRGGDPLTDGSTKRMLLELVKRPDEHEVAEVAELTALWAAVGTAVDEALAAIEGVRALDAEKHAARRTYMDAVTSSARFGKDIPKLPKARDWDAAKAERAAWARGLVGKARDARTAYDEAAARLLLAPTRLDELGKALQDAHGAAQKAVQDARKAVLKADAAYRATLAAARQAGLDQQPGSTLDKVKVTAHLDAAGTELDRLDPERLLTDTRKTRCDMQTRRALAGSGDSADRYSIFRLERSEKFAVTALTHCWPVMAPVPGAHNFEADATAPTY